MNESEPDEVICRKCLKQPEESSSEYEEEDDERRKKYEKEKSKLRR